MNNILKGFCKEKCCGCGACVNSCPVNAITYGKDEYGFTVPCLDNNKCISCGKCINVCPYHKEHAGSELQIAYAGLNKSESELVKSTSGGIFSALAQYVLGQKGYVFGSTMDENFQVKHICVTKVEELSKLQKSKYVQSFMADIYQNVKEILDTNRLVLFSGTPCQVAGLRAFLGKNIENLITVDVVCHGVPSQSLFDKYLSSLENRVGKIQRYTFRAKRRVLNDMNSFFSYIVNNRLVIKNWPEDSFNYLYMKGFIYRDSCYKCIFSNTERVSDITLCDYWGWDNYHKDDFEPLSTVSGILVNTEKGKKLLNSVSDLLYMVPTEVGNIVKYNKSLIEPVPCPEKRTELLNKIKEDGYISIDDEYRKKHKKMIFFYCLHRHIPEFIKKGVRKLRK